MVNGIIGKKVGMTQLFLEDGTVAPATVLEAGPCVVVQGKNAQADGYEAVQIGLVEGKPYKANKATAGHFKQANVPPTRVRREVRLAKGGETPELGAQVLCSIFNAGERVDVIGTSKGRGFAGVMKRHHFKGFIRSHGTHEYFRHGGSIGTRLTPGHVKKNQKMPGHMGMERVTMQNLRIVKVDPENGLLYIRGGIPGSKNGIVTIRMARKGQ
jgi:large subunit ribosomal protein L3